MRWASAISLAAGVPEAVDEIADGLAVELAGADPDLVIVFVSPHHKEEYHVVPMALSARFPRATIVGASGAGVIGGRRELEHRRGLSAIAASLPGVAITARHVEELFDEPVPEALGAPVEDTRALLVLADPYTSDAARLLAQLDATYPGVAKIGGLVSGGRQVGDNALFVGGRRRAVGAVVVALRGPLQVDTVIAQGCRPIGQPMLVTRCEDNLVLELGSEKPARVLQRLYDGLEPDDQALFRGSLFIGIEMKDQVEYRHGDWLIRNVLGFSPERDALAIGAVPAQWNAVQFHLRDAKTSSDDLSRMLDRWREEHGGARPRGALLFSCLGRGEHLYGESGHDSSAFFARLGDVPLAGFFCNGEIGPVGGMTFLHGYTSAFGIFSES